MGWKERLRTRRIFAPKMYKSMMSRCPPCDNCGKEPATWVAKTSSNSIRPGVVLFLGHKCRAKLRASMSLEDVARFSLTSHKSTLQLEREAI